MICPPGTLLGQRYETREIVGSDGTVEVYRALDLRLGRDVAVTVLDVHHLADTEEFLRFEREAQARAALQDPRIATIHDFGHDATRIYLVAEWMQGESLRSRLRKGPLDASQVRVLGMELLEGLNAIHAKGFALGALTPASVFLETDGRSKLFAYRIQRAGPDAPDAPGALGDLRSLAELLIGLLDSAPAPGARRKCAQARLLEGLRACTDGPDGPGDLSAALGHLLRESKPGPLNRRTLWAALLALLVLLAGAAAIPLLRSRPNPRLLLSVLPFRNLDRRAETDYLGPSLLHCVAAELGRTPGLRVALAGTPAPPGATAAPRDDEDPLLLARRMGADLSLSGEYSLRNDRLIVEARILRVRDGNTFSQCRVERPVSELLFLASDLEDQLRASIEDRSRRTDPSRGGFQGSRDPEAQRLCLQGLQLLNTMAPEGAERAMACFQAAIARDPSFALAHCGLSDCYCVLSQRQPREDGRRLAEAAARRALELAPDLGQAHACLAHIRLRFGPDWMGAEDEFRQAIRLDPGDAKTQQWFGLFLATLGYWEASLEHMRRAVALDPLSLRYRNNYALVLHWAGRNQEALQEFDKVLDQEPGCLVALNTLMEIQEELGRIPEALAISERIASLGGLPQKSAAALRGAFESLGAPGYWSLRVRQIEQENGQDPVRLAEAVAIQGDGERALRLLDRAIQQGSPNLVFVPKDPAFESLRSDARFAQILKRMGYPAS